MTEFAPGDIAIFINSPEPALAELAGSLVEIQVYVPNARHYVESGFVMPGPHYVIAFSNRRYAAVMPYHLQKVPTEKPSWPSVTQITGWVPREMTA